MQLDEIVPIIKESISERKEVIAVYIFGSFLNFERYEDIDIGLLLDESFTSHHLYEVRLQKKVEEKIFNTFDEYITIHITLLNHQELRFLYSILGKSKLIYCKNTIKRAKFESKVITHYLDIKPLYEYYDKMRKLRYANR